MNILKINTKIKRLCLMLFISTCFLTPGVVNAGTYWVSPSGEAAWDSCSGSTPLSGESACSLTTANKNATAGDTINLRGGTYLQTSANDCGRAYNCGIYPKNRGADSQRITYIAHAEEKPIITAEAGLKTSKGITIEQGVGEGVGTYIRVSGITFRNLYRWVNLRNYANYNEIDHCTFYSETGQDIGDVAGLTINSLCSGGNSWKCYSKHNWIHHNTFSKAHEYGNQECHEGADMIRIGIAYSAKRDNLTDEQDDYNTVEYNTIEYAGHALMDTYGGYNVIRGNVMHNEGWIKDYSNGKCTFPPMPNGLYGHRGLQTTEDYARANQYILVEGNRFGWGSANPNNPGDANYAITSPSTIVRYNYAFGSQQSGIGTKWYRACPNKSDALANRGQGGTGPYNIRIYNNTAVWNGQTYPYMHSAQSGCSTCPGKLAGINVYSRAKKVIVKNNIAYGNGSNDLYGYDITVSSGKNPANYPESITAINNWETKNGDPQFVEVDLTKPEISADHPNLTLREESEVKDKGIHLTQANSSGSNSRTLVVDDAMYFQDGTWGSALARGVTFFPDWIAIGTVTNVVEISSINYSTNTITLSSPNSWKDNDPIWLYKKSDGEIVLHDDSPDIGAHELIVPAPGGVHAK